MAVETGTDGKIVLSREPTDPRFHRPDSGWYWEILGGGTSLFKSASLGDQNLDLTGITLEEGHDVQIVYGPGQQKLRAHVAHVSYPYEPDSLTFVATAPAMEIKDDVHEFYTQIGRAHV